MKLRLTQAGFETYTGQMGVVMFKDGLSESDVLPIDAIRISAALGAEWEDGTAANVGEMYLNNMHSPAFVGGDDINSMSMPVEGEEAPVKAKSQKKTEAKQTEEKPTTEGITTEVKVYTYQELSDIADTKGINGLREVGEPMGVKGTSIVGIIEAILKAQGNTASKE